MKYFFIYLLFLFGLTACGGDNHKSYVQYVSNEDNGLVKSQHQNGLMVSANYLPVEYQVIQQIKRGLTVDEVKETLNDMQGHHYLKLKLSSNIGLHRLAEKAGKTWNEVLLQLQYHAKPKFKIKRGDIEYPCVLYHTISGIAPQREQEIMLVFINDQESRTDEDLVLIYEDDLITNTTFELIIEQDALNRIPEVELL